MTTEVYLMAIVLLTENIEEVAKVLQRYARANDKIIRQRICN